MARIPDGFIDLVITSSPYNLGDLHHTGDHRFKPYQDSLPEEDYQEWQMQILNELFRITNNNGSLIYNHKNRIKDGIQITPYQWLLKTKWVIKQEIVWFNGSQNFDKVRFYPMTERIYWLAKSPSTQLFNTINHHDLFDKKEWPPQGTGKQHRRTFPIKLVMDILKCFPEANLVYDPFMGSGTTALACIALGRNYIGSEINPEYVEMAERRIYGDLFVGVKND
jgi:modification methylase